MHVGCLTYVSVLTTVREIPIYIYIYIGLIGPVWYVTASNPTLLLLTKMQGSRTDSRTKSSVINFAEIGARDRGAIDWCSIYRK